MFNSARSGYLILQSVIISRKLLDINSFSYYNLEKLVTKLGRTFRKRGEGCSPNIVNVKHEIFLLSFSSRKITHYGQQDNRDNVTKRDIATNYLLSMETVLVGYSQNHIFNMDETPCYMDMTGTTTLDFVGAKNVDTQHTGHDKARFTTVLCISASGRILKGYIILKGLKRVPAVQLPPNVILTVSMGGSMTQDLMMDWLDRVFSSRGPYFANSPSLLLMDSHKAHVTEPVKDVMRRLNVQHKIVPPRFTSMLQPLDVTGGVNLIFKQYLREEWQEWFENGEQEFTPSGYRKKPSYQDIVGFVSRSLTKLADKSDIISRSFKLCGLGEAGAKVPMDSLNRRLRDLLESGRPISDDEQSEDDDIENDSDAELF